MQSCGAAVSTSASRKVEGLIPDRPCSKFSLCLCWPSIPLSQNKHTHTHQDMHVRLLKAINSPNMRISMTEKSCFFFLCGARNISSERKRDNEGQRGQCWSVHILLLTTGHCENKIKYKISALSETVSLSEAHGKKSAGTLEIRGVSH